MIHNDKRWRATVKSVFDGIHDHGVRTISLLLEDAGGAQSFGGLAFSSEADAADFGSCVCHLFGVSRLADCVGRSCHALYSFGRHNEPIEGLEVEARRFTVTGWRRRRHPRVKSAIEAERERLGLEMSTLAARIQCAAALLVSREAVYTDWSEGKAYDW